MADSMTRAFIFPGQGSQFIGMGKELYDLYPEAKETFQEVDEALGKDLSTLIFSGEEADLNMTENTQPALMVMSMAVVNVLKKQLGDLSGQCSFMAGHSLGEYSALTAAGALTLSDTARLLQIRGQAMQQAVPVGVGSMAAVLGLDFEDVKNIAEESMAHANESEGQELVCQAANDNSVGQVVVSGHKQAVQLAVDLATEKGAKKAVILPVSAPFHCSLMAPAAQKMEAALADTHIMAPSVPVVANVTAKGAASPEDIRKLLIDQITGMVRWRESVLWMKSEGVTEMVELGAGKVLSGLVKRIDREIAVSSVGTPEQIDQLVETLS